MSDYVKLFIPGPTEVRAEILQAQTRPMVGHRSAAFSELFASAQKKLRQVFYTNSRVYVSASSGTGLWEGASRNAVRDGRKVLHFINGAFSDRWAHVSRSNGKEVVTVELEWGRAVRGDMVREALKAGGFDAVAVVHNETSTGAMSPLNEVAAALREFPDVLFLVDAVSSAAGVKIEVDRLGIDVLVTSSQKCFALPPGLAMAAVSDRVLERARQVPHRGYYFDFLALEEQMVKSSTPATPAISLMYALDAQLDAIMTEGLDARFARHAELAGMVRQWARQQGFALFAEAGFESNTVTAVANNRSVDVEALTKHTKARKMQIDGGYGKIKGKTFRVAHMGDVRRADIEALLACMTEFLQTA